MPADRAASQPFPMIEILLDASTFVMVVVSAVAFFSGLKHILTLASSLEHPQGTRRRLSSSRYKVLFNLKHGHQWYRVYSVDGESYSISYQGY